jgi:hypothetical protein
MANARYYLLFGHNLLNEHLEILKVNLTTVPPNWRKVTNSNQFALEGFADFIFKEGSHDFQATSATVRWY